jgi:hypothetical protein
MYVGENWLEKIKSIGLMPVNKDPVEDKISVWLRENQWYT